MGKLKYNIAMISYVLAGTIGCLLSFGHTFKITYQTEAVCISVGVLCVFTVLNLCWENKWGRFAAVGTAVVGNLIIFMIYRSSFRESVAYISAKVQFAAEKYMKLGNSVQEYEETVSGSAGISLLFGIIGCLLVFLVVSVKNAWGALIILGAGFLFPFLVGEVPETKAMLLQIYAMVGIAAGKSGRQPKDEERRRYRTGFAGVIAGACMLIIGMVFPGPQLKSLLQNQSQTKKDIQVFWDDHVLGRIRNAKGGVSDGSVGEAGKFGDDDSRQLRVITDVIPMSTLYLQGYIGTEYVGNRWGEADNNKFAKWSKKEQITVQELRNMSAMFQYDDYSIDRREYEQTIHIENIGANRKYQYMPYGGYYDEKYEIEGDTYIRGTKREYDVNYSQMRPDYGAHVSFYQNIKRVEDFSGDKESAYLKYAAEEYCDVPDEMRTLFETIVEENIQSGDVRAIVDEIAALLSEQAEYSLNPGVTPEGRDVAEYFYFENKKGYCEHFATVAVIMLRLKGIPARYVSGYTVREEDFVWNQEKNQYEAVVTGDSAHAWAEVYMPYVGWMPAETTPAIQEQSDEVPVEPEAEEPVDTLTETEPVQEEEKEMENGQEDEAEIAGVGGAEGPVHVQMKKSVNLLWAVPGIAVFFIVLVFVGRRCWIVKRRRKGKRGGVNGRITALFVKINELLVLAGCIQKEEEPGEEYVRKICEAYTGIDQNEIEQMIEIVYCASFSNEKLSREEYQICQKIYRQLKKEVSANISFGKKCWWRYWWGISLS